MNTLGKGFQKSMDKLLNFFTRDLNCEHKHIKTVDYDFSLFRDHDPRLLYGECIYCGCEVETVWVEK